MVSCNSLIFPSIPNGKNVIDYLGFSFDGEKVSLRDKTVSKYHYRMYRKATEVGLRSKGIIDKNPDFYGLYKKYSQFGAKPGKGNHGNFITYVNRCIDVFGTDERVHLVRQRHMRKMNRTIKNPVKKKETTKVMSGNCLKGKLEAVFNHHENSVIVPFDSSDKKPEQSF